MCVCYCSRRRGCKNKTGRCFYTLLPNRFRSRPSGTTDPLRRRAREKFMRFNPTESEKSPRGEKKRKSVICAGPGARAAAPGIRNKTGRGARAAPAASPATSGPKPSGNTVPVPRPGVLSRKTGPRARDWNVFVFEKAAAAASANRFSSLLSLSAGRGRSARVSREHHTRPQLSRELLRSRQLSREREALWR